MEDEEVRDTFVIPIRLYKGAYEVFIINKDSDEGDKWIDLSYMKEWSENNINKVNSGRMYRYFLAFLDLATSLCYDRSYKGINAFKPIFPLDITFGCAKNENLPFEMRSRFTDLLLALHVDKQPLEPLRVPTLTRIWDVFEDGDNDMPVKEKIPEELNPLKDFIKNYLINEKGMQKSYERDKNYMTLSVLNLSKNLIIFGFYRTENELIEMIDPLITLLDGSHDVTSQEEEEVMKSNNALESVAPDIEALDNIIKPGFTRFKTRYEMTESNLTVMKCKNKMCEILGIVMDIQNDIRVTRFLREFNNRLVNEVSNDDDSRKKSFLKKLGLNVESKGSLMTHKINEVFERLLQDRKLDLEELSWADYVCINLDLIMYHDEKLLNKAFSLLIRFHSQRKSLLDLLRSVQMLESDQAIETLRKIEQMLTDLRKIAQNSEFWLGQNDRESLKTAKQTVDIFNFLSNLLIQKELNNSIPEQYENEEMVIQRHATENPFLEMEESKGHPSSTKGKKFGKDLEDFVNEKLNIEKPLQLDNESPNQEYQRMLRNLEAHEIVMIIIKQTNERGITNVDLYQKVIKSGYSCLIRFVRNNKSNQRCLLPYVDSVFKAHSASGLGATQLVGEILRDDPSLFQKGYSDFKDKIDSIEATDIGSYLKSTQLHYMSVFMQYKEDPIKDNQIAVITELTQKDNLKTIYCFNSEEERIELSVMINELTDHVISQLNKNSTSIVVEIPPQLTYAIELLNVMAVATRGKNAITEVMCQSILPSQDFIK